MDELIIRLIERGGYWGVALLMAIENIVPPIPSEVIMGVGGIAVARGTMKFWPLLLFGTAGSTAGNYVWFLLGDRLGYERLRPFVKRWGRWLTLTWRDVERASAFFHGHGQWIVFALRFSPFFRTLISLPAGLAHMKHWRFLALTFAGALIWDALLILGGQWLAAYLGTVHKYIGPGLGLLLVVIIAIYVWRVIRWKPDEDDA